MVFNDQSELDKNETVMPLFRIRPISNWLQRIKLPEINYFNILFFIGSFWIVFAANALAQKKVLTGKASF